MLSWTMLSFLASSFATFSKASFILSKVHSAAFTSVLKVLLYSPQSPSFQRKERLFHHSVSTISIIAALHLLQALLAGDSCCYWPCILACHYFPPSSRNLFTLNLSQQEYSHISRMYCPFPIIFHNLPRSALFSTNSYHRHFVNGSSPFATRDSL